MTSGSPFHPDALEFFVLPGHPRPGFKRHDIYNAAYQHYRAVWSRTFERRAGSGVFDPYAFFRQDYVMVLMQGSTVAAHICGSFLDLDTEIVHDLSYFENFKGVALEVLQSEGARRMMTLEFSSIDREFSPRKIGGLCLNEVMTQLGARFGIDRGADVITGLPRRVTGTNDKVVRSGFRRIEEGRARLGLSVDIVLGFRGELKPHPDEAVQALTDCLWQERIDTTQAPSPLATHTPLSTLRRSENDTPSSP